ncbi:hypothetical protein SLS62_008600 [Diatrype stigma]|uniref:Secreted protein n=1 Tax=Diatrype stigma TaxID=117547 RepID=A0AAN9YN25_9PEZI
MHSYLSLPFLAAVLPTSASPLHQWSNRSAPASLPQISSVSYSGSGCPSSSPAVVRSGAFADPAFRLNAFEARVPDGTSTVNCQVHIQAEGASSGWQLGLESVTVHGHLVLDPGASLDWFVTSFFSQDADKTVTVRGSLPNSGGQRLSQDVASTTHIPAANIVWGPCTSGSGDVGLLNVNFRVALQTDGGQYGFFGKDADTAPAESWTYAWRRC